MAISTQQAAPTSSANDPRSRYVLGGSTDSTTQFLNWWDRKLIPPAPDDIPLVIARKYNRKPWLMAFDLYGKAKDQWIILQFNNIVDINTEFVQGARIKVPTAQRILTLS